MKCLKWSVLLLVLLMAPVVVADNQTISTDFQGDCQDYIVTVSAEGFESGCYDVKVDLFDYGMRVGEVYDQKKGWKSSMYYVNEILCVPEENQTTLKVKANSDKNLTGEVKLRRGSKVWEQEVTLIQDCPEAEPVDPGEFLGMVTAVVVILAAGVYFYKRH